MKNNLLYLLFIVVGLSSCSKDDDPVFDKSPDERINETLDKYQAALLAAADGWKATIVPANGATYHYYFRFNDSNRVFMQADFDTTSASVTGQSSYRLKALQQPCLIFDTYSYLHLLSDPDGSVNGGDYGGGLYYDFEFAIDTVTADSIKMTGRFNGSKLILQKATRAERTAWENQSWAKSLTLQHVGKFLTYFTRLEVGGQQFDLNVDPLSRRITFYTYSGSGSRHGFTTLFTYSPSGVELTTPFNTGSGMITGFTHMNWDSVDNKLWLQVNGAPASISSAIAPIVVDLTAPTRWRQSAILEGTYWISVTGFTKSKKLDALNIFSIPNYYYTMYYPRFGTSGGVTYDFGGIAYVNNNALAAYGPAFRPPVFTPDGRIIFSLLGTYGAAPSSGSISIMSSVGTEYTQAEGYYFIQTSPSTYDMVCARDARSWIKWQALD
ncbi:DUF4302 domain-containing protein [Pseudoflavitalea sp. X16]|uniref:DUF4302 domain-containing protein n=1 Tax=Paraflavitalea devenefica TaxID=2716334 RepID=UPI0014241C32|nr:DUF4302 domain-containing protein [Paraflavitalea devenefica]NII27893.1 DUF4302 domain-containing protein [Paraflavitalea devenefica]